MSSEKLVVLDRGFVQLIDFMGSDHRIAEAAWVSTQEEAAAEGRTEKDVERIINYMMRNRHTSPFEQVEFVFRMKMPIFVARQIIRHRTANVNEMSGRYRELPAESYLPELDRIGGRGKSNKQGTEGELSEQAKEEALNILRGGQDRAWGDYSMLNNLKISREIARIDLPVATYTEWMWKCDLHNIFHMLSLRLDPHAQWETRQYAKRVYEIVKKRVPLACAAFEEYVLYAVRLSRSQMMNLGRLLDDFPAGAVQAMAASAGPLESPPYLDVAVDIRKEIARLEDMKYEIAKGD